MSYTLVILFFPLALFLPGYLVVSGFTNLPISADGLHPRAAPRSDLQAIERIDCIRALFLSVFLSASLTGVISLALAQVGCFSLPALMGILLLVCLGVGGMLGLKQGTLRWRVVPSPTIEWVAVASVVAGAVVLFLHPHECILGGADAGVYVNLGANLSNTGALLIREPLLTEVDPGLLPGLLREQLPDAPTRFIRLPGFYLSDTEPGLVIPQFYPLHPVWLGVGYSLFGVAGALLVTPVWGVLGVVAVYLCGRSLFEWQVGWLAAVLLLVTPLQVYFARYPTAEPITQFLVWAGLLAFSMFAQDRSPRGLWGLAAGAALGGASLARVDVLPVLLIPAGWAVALLRRRRWDSSEWWFWLPLVGFTGYALFHGLVFSRPYTVGTYGWAITFLWRRLGLAMVVIAVAGALGFWLIGRMPRCNSARTGRLPWKLILRSSGAAMLVGLAVYAYFIRPRVGDVVLAPYWYGEARIPFSNHENLVRLGWYLSPLGIGLAVVGGVLLVFQERWSRLWPLWVAGGAFTVLFIHNIYNNPFQIYAMRRYVPVVVPFFVLAGAYAVWWLWRRAPWRKVGRVTGAVLFIVLIGWLSYNGRLIWGQRDYRGAVEQVAHLADLFEDEAIVLFVDDAPVGMGAVLGTPLQFLHGITAFDLQEDDVEAVLLQEQVARWLRTGRPVYIAKGSASSAPLPDECLIPAGTARLDVPVLEQTYEHVPSTIQRVRYEVEVYRVGSACQFPAD